MGSSSILLVPWTSAESFLRERLTLREGIDGPGTPDQTKGTAAGPRGVPDPDGLQELQHLQDKG